MISGGGGGWYGGGYARYVGAGGGSGYIYTSNTASNYPDGCLLNNNYYLTNTSCKAGNEEIPYPTKDNALAETTTEIGHSGDGYVRITILKVKGNFSIFPRANGIDGTATSAWTKIDGVWKNISAVSIKNSDTWHFSVGSSIKDSTDIELTVNIAPVTTSSMNANNYVTINGNKYISASTIKVKYGTKIGITLKTDRVGYYGVITVDGNNVFNDDGTYEYTVTQNCTIAFEAMGISQTGYYYDCIITTK